MDISRDPMGNEPLLLRFVLIPNSLEQRESSQGMN